MFEHFEEYDLGIRPMLATDVAEIDNIAELAELDSSYREYLKGENDE